MRIADRTIIGNIIAVYPSLYILQDEIEKEQEQLIADLTSPAERVVHALIALDNRRIDLCNLKVLYAFMERELGVSFAVLKEYSERGYDSKLFDRAEKAINAAGYTIDRAKAEFSYLFKRLINRRRRRVPTKTVAARAALCNAR